MECIMVMVIVMNMVIVIIMVMVIVIVWVIIIADKALLFDYISWFSLASKIPWPKAQQGQKTEVAICFPGLSLIPYCSITSDLTT